MLIGSLKNLFENRELFTALRDMKCHSKWLKGKWEVGGKFFVD
jgi:hypothetical protein